LTSRGTLPPSTSKSLAYGIGCTRYCRQIRCCRASGTWPTAWPNAQRL